MRLSRQFQVCLFFLREDFARTKSTKMQKKATFTLLEVSAHKKMLALLFSVCLILFCWLMSACECFCCARNIFVKKIKQAWNCLDNRILQYYLCLVFYEESHYPVLQARVTSVLLLLSETDLLPRSWVCKLVCAFPLLYYLNVLIKKLLYLLNHINLYFFTVDRFSR